MSAPLDDQVVPSAGMSVYDYSESNLSQVSVRQMLIGLIVLAAAIAYGLAILFKATTIDFPALYGLLAVFFATGAAMFIWGLHLLMTARHAELVLYPDGFCSRDKYGRSSSRVPYSQVLRCTVNTWSKPYFRSWIDQRRHRSIYPTHFKVNLVTTVGKITFYDDISGWSKLRDYFMSIQTAPSAEGVFRYWDLTTFCIGAVATPATIFIGRQMVDQYRAGATMKVNGHVVPTSLGVHMLGLAMVGFFFCVGVYFFFGALLERIVIKNGRIRSYNWFGWPTVTARIDQIEHGSFEKGSSGVRSVQTLKGEISWGWGISNYSTLNAIMQKASDASNLGKESQQPFA